MKRLIGITIAVVTAILNWWAFYYIAVHFGSQNPWFMATSLLTAIVIHELGHWIVLEISGIRTYLIFLVILGGALPDPSLKRRHDALPWGRQAFINLAGVLGNVLMVFGAFVLRVLGYISDRELLSIANLNGSLILYNLFPLFIFDGGRFAKVLFNSVPEDKDFNYVFAIGIPYLVAAILASILTGGYFLTGAFILLWGLQFQARNDDPNGSNHRLAMPPAETRRWAALYIALLCIGLWWMAITPSWMY